MNLLASPGQLRASFIRWLLVCIPTVLLLGFLSGELSQSGPENPWFAELAKPALYPPPAVFGIVWTVLYVLIGTALAMIVTARGARMRSAAVIVFGAQFALNLAWSPIFFATHQISAALVVIVLLDLTVMVTIVLFWLVRPVAGVLLLPYLLWICFATYLNYALLEANPSLDGAQRSGAVERFEI